MVCHYLWSSKKPEFFNNSLASQADLLSHSWLLSNLELEINIPLATWAWDEKLVKNV